MRNESSKEIEKWNTVKPEVNTTSEFLEIASDFGEPLEIIREAISNSIDWNATFIKIKTEVKKYKGNLRLFITFLDDGDGMKKEVISKDFWGLGFSKSRDDLSKIGEKGHGTKIFLRSQKVQVFTKSVDGSFEAFCDEPFADLSEGKLHMPVFRECPIVLDDNRNQEHGTKIIVIGYNDNNRGRFTRGIIKDYIQWFTKVGSVEKEFGIEKNKKFKVYLECIDSEGIEEEITFGHVFPEINDNLDKLIEEYESEAANYFVKRYTFSKRLEEHTEVTYKSFYSIEGDEIKRLTNPMISHRNNKQKGTYRVSDRYGIWLCKDYIPIVRKNDWVVNFGTGSNAYVMIHGFINCQNLLLTANRGDISNTDPGILDELSKEIKKEIEFIDLDLKKNGVYYLREQQQIEKSFSQEKAEYKRRIKEIEKKRKIMIDGQELYEPQNESEIFGLVIKLYSLRPELFDFIPIDYNTTRGIDIIAKNKKANESMDNEYAYIELKYILRADFNHAFQFLRWIICWDFSQKINKDTEFTGLAEENDIRKLKYEEDNDGLPLYYLEGKGKAIKVEVIRLKEMIEKKMGLVFS